MTNDPLPLEPTGIDPNGFATAADFGAALTELRHRRGLSIRQVAKVSEIPPATIGGYSKGRHLPPLTQPQILDALLEALAVSVAERELWRAAVARIRKKPGRVPAAVAPYRGLESYSCDEAVPFVGRESETAAILQVVERLADDSAGPRSVLVVGPSGSGKSSLIRAGVIPTARRSGFTVIELDTRDPRLLSGPLEIATAPTDRTLVVIDHLEQLLTGTADSDAATHDRIGQIVDLASQPGIVVLLGLRADFYDRALSESTMLAVLQNQFPVGPMSTEQLRRVIEEPARNAEKPVDPALVDAILSDLGVERARDAVLLPLLSHALLMTWERAHGRGLTRDAYREIGGLSGAVNATAEAAFASLDDPARRATRRLFNSMILRDAEGRLVRRPVDFIDLAGDMALIDAAEAFVGARILTASESSYSIAHESTMMTWPRLAAWLEEDTDAARVRRQIASATTNWTEHDKSDDGLIRGGLLEAAQALTEADTLGLTATEQEFVARSSQARALRQRTRRLAVLRLRAVAASALILALVTSALAVFLADARSSAIDARDQALSREVAAHARLLAATDPTLAAQLAVAANRIYPTVESRSAVLESTGERMATRLLAPPGPTRAAPSPNGRLLATANADGNMRVYTQSPTSAPALASTTPVSTGQLYGLAWSPDGRQIVLGSATGRLALYDVTDPTRPTAIAVKELGASAGVENVRFSADGHLVYAATGAPDVVRWDVRKPLSAPLAVAKDFGGAANDVAIAPNGMMAVASADGHVRLYKPHAGRFVVAKTLDLGGPDVYSYAVAFSPDGRLLAEGEKDKVARIYDVSGDTPRLVATLGGFTGWVDTVAFSPDGRKLAAGATGDLVQVWEVGAWAKALQIPGTSNVTSVAFSRDSSELTIGTLSGTTLITPSGSSRPATTDDTIWNYDNSPDGRSVFLGAGSKTNALQVVDEARAEGPTLTQPFTGPATAGKQDGSSAASPDGRWVASGTSTGAVLLWKQTGSRQKPFVINVAGQLIETNKFSHDSRTLAASSDDGSVTLIDVTGATPKVVRKLTIKGYAFAAGFSPNDSTIAVVGTTNTVTLFSARTGARILTLTGFANYTYSASFSPNGQYLAAAGADKKVLLWDLSNPSSPKGLDTAGVGPTDTIYNVAWSPNSSQLLAASQDGSVWIWNVDPQGASAYANLSNLGAGATDAGWLPNSDILAVGFNGAVDTWSGNVAAATARICGRTGATITPDEWALYVPGASYRKPCG